MERDYSNDYDAWLAETGGDTGYGGTIPTDQGGETPPAPQRRSYSWWSDPDNDPPEWMLNPGTPPIPATTGYYWSWAGDHWTMLPSPAAHNTATPPPTPPPGGNTDPGPGGVNTTYGGYGGGTYPGFRSTISPRASFGAVPEFNAPRFEAPPPFAYTKTFTAPTAQELQADPSFQFRLDQGRKALEQSAAGKGVLRTGGTLKDLVNYGQNFASNEYGNVYNRKFGEYKFDYDKEADTYARNYGVSRDVFDRNYKASYDEFQPKLTGWQTNANADQRAAEMQFQNEWDRYLADRNYDLEKRKMFFNANPT